MSTTPYVKQLKNYDRTLPLPRLELVYKADKNNPLHSRTITYRMLYKTLEGHVFALVFNVQTQASTYPIEDLSKANLPWRDSAKAAHDSTFFEIPCYRIVKGQPATRIDFKQTHPKQMIAGHLHQVPEQQEPPKPSNPPSPDTSTSNRVDVKEHLQPCSPLPSQQHLKNLLNSATNMIFDRLIERFKHTYGEQLTKERIDELSSLFYDPELGKQPLHVIYQKFEAVIMKMKPPTTANVPFTIIGIDLASTEADTASTTQVNNPSQQKEPPDSQPHHTKGEHSIRF